MNEPAKVNQETGEIVSTTSVINDEMLASIQSFDDALTIVKDVFGGNVLEADKVLGNGFSLLDEKAGLIGVPFIIMTVRKNPSDKGDKGRFWTLQAVTKDGRKVIINDGGSGIADQMDELEKRVPESLNTPMLVKRGLRASSYVHPTAGPSITYYLDTSGTV